MQWHRDHDFAAVAEVVFVVHPMRWQRLAGCASQGAKMTQFVMWVIWLFMTVAVIVWAAVFLLIIRILGEMMWLRFCK